MKLYNTLTRSLETFTPLDASGRTVRMYACGPTVYDDPHIGHVRSAFVFDVLCRVLAARGLQVTFVRNVTDVDDKIIDRARLDVGTGELKAACRKITEKYTARYHAALERLGIGKPTHEPRAMEHVVPEMTDFISQLLINGVAYEASGDVYFAVRKFTGYGKLSNRSLDELQVGVRVEPGEHKQDPLDFALWKAAKPDEPSWDSPWGKGRPGWHIECSAMSTKLLGDAFDIHGGGLDLIFPHHENEIAQAQALGKPFAKLWMHHGLLTVNGEKMAKSRGNWISVDQVFADYSHPDYLKMLFLKTHYRSPMDYSKHRMEEAKKNWEEFSRFFQHYDQVTQGASPSGGTDTDRAEIYRKKKMFDEAIDDDLNTPQALAAMFDLVNLGHQLLESQASMKLLMARWAHDVLIECGTVLGLFLQGVSEEGPQVVQQIASRLKERDEARKRKDYTKADRIRSELAAEGFLLTDTAGTTLWRRKGT